MTALLAPAASRTSAASRINPVAKLFAAAIIAVALLFSLDWVSAAGALGLELVLLPLAGVAARRLALRLLPLAIAAVLAGSTVVLYGRASGATYLDWALIHVTDGSIELAVATALRILAIALPSVVLFLTVDTTELADGLAQVLHLPSRFVVGALGGVRLLGLFAEDWRSLELARRARGIADRGRLRRFLGQAFALLVLSIRRGTKVATAMEARGFGGPGRRTWARESRLRPRDAVVVVIAVAVAAAAIGAAVAAGTWGTLA